MAPSHTTFEQVDHHIASIYTLAVSIDDKVLYAYRRTLFEKLVEARAKLAIEERYLEQRMLESEIDIREARLKALAAFEVFRATVLRRDKV